jgi:hypothetical protein
MSVYLGFEVAPEKKIAWGQIWRTRRPPDVTTQGVTCPGNICLRILSEQRDVWDVAPSCWSHTFSAPSSSKRSSNFGWKNLPFNLGKHQDMKSIAWLWSVKFLITYPVGTDTESGEGLGNTNERVNIPKVYWLITYSYERHNSYLGREQIVSIWRFQYSHVF